MAGSEENALRLRGQGDEEQKWKHGAYHLRGQFEFAGDRVETWRKKFDESGAEQHADRAHRAYDYDQQRACNVRELARFRTRFRCQIAGEGGDKGRGQCAFGEKIPRQICHSVTDSVGIECGAGTEQPAQHAFPDQSGDAAHCDCRGDDSSGTEEAVLPADHCGRLFKTGKGAGLRPALHRLVIPRSFSDPRRRAPRWLVRALQTACLAALPTRSRRRPPMTMPAEILRHSPSTKARPQPWHRPRRWGRVLRCAAESLPTSDCQRLRLRRGCRERAPPISPPSTGCDGRPQWRSTG